MKKIIDNYKKSVILNGLGTIGIVGSTTALVLTNVFTGWTFILAAIACFPMAKVIWQYVVKARHNTIRILHKLLPKIGYVIEETEWNEDHSVVHFIGTFQGDFFLVQASNNSEMVQIYDYPWLKVKSSDPNILHILEAINEVNGHQANMSIFLEEANAEGDRYISTLTQTIIPIYRSTDYLNYLLCDMLNRKLAFEEIMNKEYHHMTQRRSPIGFSGQQP